jgi:hypothetical protein
MANKIDVIRNDDETLVRCQLCGLTCAVPVEVRLAQLSDFLRDHRDDIHPALHPAQCPAWARKVEAPA